MAAARLLALLALTAVSSSGTSDCSYEALIHHLNLTSSSYLSFMRPVRHWATPTPVFVDMLLYGIVEVDEKFQTVLSHIGVFMKWQNEFLSWDPADFCGIELLPVQLSQLWVPDVIIKEDVSDTSSSQRSPLALVSADGWVHANSRHMLTSTCKLNLQLFPFDRQKCSVSFGSMSSSDDIISMRMHGNGDGNSSSRFRINNQTMVTHGEWALHHIQPVSHIETNSNFTQSAVVYEIVMDRKPLLYVVIFMVPLLYLLVLDLASFFISESRGEKLGFKITILLPISVLLLILKDILPSTEDSLPMIANFCAGIFALVGLSVLEAMLMTFLIDLDSFCVRKKKKKPVEVELEVGKHIENDEKAEVKPEKGSYQPDELLNQILQQVKAARQELNKRAESRPNCFYRVAQILDMVFFALYLATVVVFLLFMYVIWLSPISGSPV